MREFIVELNFGKRLVVRADRCVPRYEGTIDFLIDVAPSDEIGRYNEAPQTVAIFDRRQVMWIADKEHLLSEGKWSPTSGSEQGALDEESPPEPGGF